MIFKNAAKVLLFFDICKKKASEDAFFPFTLSFFHSLIPKTKFPIPEFDNDRLAAIYLAGDDGF